MSVSRRELFRRLTVGVATGAALSSVAGWPVAGSPPQGTATASVPVLLDHNENAYGPSDKVFAVLRESAVFGNRYPRAQIDVLIEKIAALHNVKPDQVVLAPGSTAILRSSASLFLASGKKLVQASPTFPSLGNFARVGGAEVLDVRLNKRYQHDLDATLASAGDSAGLIYICNPNNPTATLTPRKDIETFIRRLPSKTIVLIDEAYHHFVNPNGEYTSFLDQPLGDPRIVVVRTFSKVYGLAGMRVGYAVAAPEVARRLNSQRLQADVTVISARAAAAALDDPDYVRMAIQRNADDRQEFLNHVNGYMIRALDSHTNFVLLNPMRPPDQVIQHLKANNILIAPAIPAMPQYVRVSLGTPAEMEKFWAAWDLMPPTGKMAM
jgi:histidinol-phosphate aminotransferase